MEQTWTTQKTVYTAALSIIPFAEWSNPPILRRLRAEVSRPLAVFN